MNSALVLKVQTRRFFQGFGSNHQTGRRRANMTLWISGGEKEVRVSDLSLNIEQRLLAEKDWNLPGVRELVLSRSPPTHDMLGFETSVFGNPRGRIFAADRGEEEIIRIVVAGATYPPAPPYKFVGVDGETGVVPPLHTSVFSSSFVCVSSALSRCCRTASYTGGIMFMFATDSRACCAPACGVVGCAPPKPTPANNDGCCCCCCCPKIPPGAGDVPNAPPLEGLNSPPPPGEVPKEGEGADAKIPPLDAGAAKPNPPGAGAGDPNSPPALGATKGKQHRGEKLETRTRHTRFVESQRPPLHTWSTPEGTRSWR